MHPQSTPPAEPATRTIKARYLSAGMTVVYEDGTRDQVTGTIRYGDDVTATMADGATGTYHVEEGVTVTGSATADPTPTPTPAQPDPIADALRGPWLAVLADLDGTVYPTYELAARDLPDDAEMTVRVVRDTAMPVDDPDGDGMQLAEQYHYRDLAYEIDAWLIDPDDESVGARARYAQAQHMADGLNAAGVTR